jgi:hypothetical protein
VIAAPEYVDEVGDVPNPLFVLYERTIVTETDCDAEEVAE